MNERKPGVGPALSVALTLSALALIAAPLLMPESYSWIANTTSESAAQGVDGAWLARAGFAIFGAAVIVLSLVRAKEWGMIGAAAHLLFGICMLATAAFSTRSWVQGATFNETQDTLHSISATLMGFAYAAGVVAVALTAKRRSTDRRFAFDFLALVASAAIPLAMLTLPDADGLLQRAMFAVAYLWYGREAWIAEAAPYSRTSCP